MPSAVTGSTLTGRRRQLSSTALGRPPGTSWRGCGLAPAWLRPGPPGPSRRQVAFGGRRTAPRQRGHGPQLGGHRPQLATNGAFAHFWSVGHARRG